MLGFNARSNQGGLSEVDTKAPFQSVKAAIGLFGPSINNGSVHKRSRSNLDERVLEKETQHHLTIKELESLKEQLRNIETTKAQAAKDLEKAKYTLETLTTKLDTLCESKLAAIVATEEAKKRLEKLEEERLQKKGVKLVDTVRDEYKATNAEISSVKQDITSLKTDFDATLDAKLAAIQEDAEAQHVIRENQQKTAQLSEQIANLKKELDEVRLIEQQAHDEHSKLVAEKLAKIQPLKAAREKIEKKISSLRKEPGLDDEETDKIKLEETNEAITSLTEKLEIIRASDMEALNSTNSELESVKEDLQQRLYEQNSLTTLVGTLKVKVQKNVLSIAQAEELKKQAEAYKQEAQAARLATEEIEKNLQIAQTEAEEVKSALKLGSTIKLSAKDFDELKKRAEKSKTDEELKVATAKAQAETIKENEKPLLYKIEEGQKESDALKASIEDAINQAKAADAAKKVAEEELQKLRSETKGKKL